MRFHNYVLVSLRLSLRYHYFLFASGFALAVMLAALMAAQFSGRQPATVALDVGISVVRLCVPFWTVFLVQELLHREFDRRLFMTSLTYPLSRLAWLYSRVVVVLGLGWLMQLALFGLLQIEVLWISGWYAQSAQVADGLQFWAAVLPQLLDLAVLVGVAVLLGVTASTSSFVLLGTLGFMLLARSYADVVALLTRSPWVVGDAVAEDYRGGIGALFYLLPDLGGLDLRDVALYSTWKLVPENFHWLLVSAVMYLGFFLVISALALQRKKMA